MNKQSDFGNDLAALKENVSTEVGSVLQVLQERRTKRPTGMKDKTEPKADAAEVAGAADTSIRLTAETESPRRKRATRRSRLVSTMDRDEPRDNVTFKLRLQTDELLEEAALRQRIKKETPYYRQDIVEAALDDWFRKHGYKPRGSHE